MSPVKSSTLPRTDFSRLAGSIGPKREKTWNDLFLFGSVSDC